MTDPSHQITQTRTAVWLTRNQLALVFGFALCLLLGLVWLVWKESRRELNARQMVTHTLLVLKQSIELESAVVSMEASQRGYLITGQANQLINREASRKASLQALARLNALVSDNPSQLERLKQFRTGFNRRYSIMAANSKFALSDGLPAARLRFQSRGSSSVEPLRNLLEEIRVNENHLLAERIKISDTGLARFQLLLIIGTAFTLVTLSATGYLLLRQLTHTELVSKQLAQSNEQLKLAYEVSRIGSWELNLKTGKTTRSLLHDQIFGHQHALPEWTYESFQQQVHPDDLEHVDARFKGALASGGDWDFECRIFWPDKSLHWVWACGRVFQSSDGTPFHMLGTITDITERKTAIEALRASEERAQTIINTAYDAFVAIDSEGKIIAWNTQAVSIFGWSRDEAIGQTLSDTIIPKQHRQAHAQGIEHFNTTGHGPQLNKRIELTALHRDGHEFPVELTIWPLSSNGIVTFNAFLRDISALRLAEDERDRFFSLSLDMLCISSADGYFKRLSPAFTRILGWSIDELLARPYLDFIHPDDHAATLIEVERQIEAGEPVQSFENRYLHKDGSWRVLSWKSVPQPDGRIYAVARDVTEFKQTAQHIVSLNEELMARHAALEASNRELESFSYSVSHDLRAPLRHIDGFARMLAEDSAEILPKESKRYLQVINDSAKRMGHLIDDLLAFSQLGRKPVAELTVDMQNLVETVITELRAGDPKRPLHFELSALPEANGDPALLKQVWANLLSNAVKYSAPRGELAKIVISGEIMDKHIHYSVSDNGVGFDMRYADKLFGVFQRLHSQDQFEGTGVGLAIVQRIIHRHGGSVAANAELDHGACFTFKLPINEG